MFKYADRTALYFQCQIAINIKEPKAECQRPKCPSPPLRGKRSIETRNFTQPSGGEDRPDLVMDVFTSLTSVDIESAGEEYEVRKDLKMRAEQQHVCLSTGGISALVLALAISFISAVTSGIYFGLQQSKR